MYESLLTNDFVENLETILVWWHHVTVFILSSINVIDVNIFIGGRNDFMQM